jgi:hypothetical protein
LRWFLFRILKVELEYCTWLTAAWTVFYFPVFVFLTVSKCNKYVRRCSTPGLRHIEFQRGTKRYYINLIFVASFLDIIDRGRPGRFRDEALSQSNPV